MSQLKNEFVNLKNMKHKNIVEVYKLFIHNNAGYVYLLMEYFEGVEMFKYIQDVGIYSGRSC